jgi:hypothetical protein
MLNETSKWQLNVTNLQQIAVIQSQNSIKIGVFAYLDNGNRQIVHQRLFLIHPVLIVVLRYSVIPSAIHIR